MCSSDNLEPRIVELETRLAFQDDLLEQLNRIVSAQQISLDQCTRRLDAVERMVRRVRDARPGESDDTQPA